MGERDDHDRPKDGAIVAGPGEVPPPGSALARLERPSPLVSLHLLERVADFAEAAKAPRTRAAYRTAFAQFVAWCEERHLLPLPAAPGTVALYLSFRADQGKKVATIEIDLAAIGAAHLAAGLTSPRTVQLVKDVLRGIRRKVGVAPRKKAPLAGDEMRAMLLTLGDDLQGARDRALLLVGFLGAFRRSELVAIDREDVTFVKDGLEVVLRRSKTDPEAAGVKVGIPASPRAPEHCPVLALRAWLELSGIREGALFRSLNRYGEVRGRLSADGVARLVKRVARAAGVEADVSGHSLRAGFVTAAVRKGRPEWAIMRQTRHRSVATLRTYIREADVFSNNPGKGLL